MINVSSDDQGITYISGTFTLAEGEMWEGQQPNHKVHLEY